MSEPINKELYNSVKKVADKKFKSKTGIYKSSWIVQEYKRRGGKYKGKKTSKTGLLRWYKEKWIDLNRPIKDKKGKIIGYEECGRKTSSKGKYPLCRPTYRVTKSTPKTYSEISKKSILKAKKIKAKVKGKKNIQFGSGRNKKLYKCKICNKELLGLDNFKNHIDQHLKFKCEICDYKKEVVETQYADPEDYKNYNKLENLDKKNYENIKIYINKTEGGSAQFYGKKSSKMVAVPKNVKKWAKYAFKLRDIGFKGAIETGWKRAEQLSIKEYIPIEDLRYMRNWYARHIYTSYPTFKEWIDAGRPKTKDWHNRRGIQAWITWGANAGFKWINSDKVINMLNKHFDKNYKKIKIKV